MLARLQIVVIIMSIFGHLAWKYSLVTSSGAVSWEGQKQKPWKQLEKFSDSEKGGQGLPWQSHG